MRKRRLGVCGAAAGVTAARMVEPLERRVLFSTTVVGDGLGSVSGIVYDDANGNGVRDAGEGPLGGQTVTFGVVNRTRTLTTTTGADGAYTFGGLAPETYSVEYVPPPERLLPRQIPFVTLAADEDRGGVDLAASPAGVARGTLFNDADRDGVRDAGEAGLAGYTVYSGYEGDRYRGTELRTVTDAAGNYAFGHLLPTATLDLRVVPKQGALPTAPAPSPATRRHVVSGVAPGETRGGLDFGFTVAAPVTSLTLVDSDTDRAVPGVTLAHGTVIDLAATGRRLNIAAALGRGPAGSVRFSYDGNPAHRVENTAPYSIGGDSAGNLLAWTPTVGTHTLVVTAYAGPNGTGERAASQAIVFDVVDTAPLPSPVRVNAGGTTFTTSTGRTFAADNSFSGGSKLSTSTAIAGTVDDRLYQTRREGSSFTFNRTVRPGAYTVTLHFAETRYAAAGQRRKFDVAAEGRTVLDDYDIVREAGAAAAAIKTFPVTVVDERLTLSFRGVVGAATVSAVELTAVRAVPQAQGAVYAAAGGAEQVDALNRRFSPIGFAGGTTVRDARDVENTADDALFASYRAGSSFSFSRPAANGNYVLWVEMAEPTATAAGQRLFDVAAEGRTVLDDYDLFADAGGANRAVAKAFDVTVTDGAIDLRFAGVTGGAVVSAVALIPADVPEAARASDVRYGDTWAHEEVRKVVAQSNLRWLGYALQMYQNEHKGQFPPDLVTVAAEDSLHLTDEMFTTPRSDTRTARGELSKLETVGRVRTLVDLVYVRPPTRWAGADVVLAHENPARVPGGINVLFADGHVEYRERADAAANLGIAMPGTEPFVLRAPRPAVDPASRDKREQLRDIGFAMQMFANENKGRLPHTFADLFVTQHPRNVTATDFFNPRGTTAPPPADATPARQVELVAASTDYLYPAGNRRAYGSPDDVNVYENPADMPGGIHLLFADGRVEFRETRPALETIARPRT